ncbi:MAG: CPBP family glutamic-type intramembrane protease [Acidimicrobiales bacterium]
MVGTAMLAGTLAAPSGSRLFFGLGLLAALVWVAGARLSGPIAVRGHRGVAGFTDIGFPVVLGALLFGAFVGAKLIADQIPVLSGSVARVLARADSGPRTFILVVALVNGVGEELFFRGAVPSAFKTHASVWATAVYCGVTIATLNLALVAAALIMGTVFSLERRATGGVLAPILTHLSWSTLVIFALPR